MVGCSSPLMGCVVGAHRGLCWCDCGVSHGVHFVAGGGSLWAVDRFVIMSGHGLLHGGHSGCWLWLQVVFGHHCVWVLVIGCGGCLSVAVCGHWCSWAVVVCHCRWLLWVVIAIHHVGSCCWSLHVLLLVVRRREATLHCQTNIVCYPSQPMTPWL